MSFQNKYIKYKKKYLDLRKQIGGSGNSGGGGEALQPRPTLSPDVMNNILESLTNKEIIYRCSLNKIDCQAVSWSKLIIDRKINPNSVLNLNGPLPAMCRHITNVSEQSSCRIFYNYTKYTKPFKTIAVGSYHSMALKSDGTVVAWGRNNNGQCNVPDGLNNVVAIAAGDDQSMALKSDGTVVTWGYGTVVGWGFDNDRRVVPDGLNNVVSIAAGFHHSMALKNDGTVVVWGQRTVPDGLNNVVAIAAGYNHSMALKRDGTVVAWGECDIPAGLNNVVSIADSYYHSIALKRDGSVVAWGSNSDRQCNVPVDLIASTI